MPQSRHPAGAPSGGRFAPHAHAEPDVTLAEPEPPGRDHQGPFHVPATQVAEGDHVQPNMFVGSVTDLGHGRRKICLVDSDGQPFGEIEAYPDTVISYFAGGSSANVTPGDGEASPGNPT